MLDKYKLVKLKNSNHEFFDEYEIVEINNDIENDENNENDENDN